jgi:branched-chain amino acid transport system substrate-binding protein
VEREGSRRKEEGEKMAQQEVSRRDFLKQLGVTVGTAAVGGLAAASAVPAPVEAQQPKGRIPDTPYKTGHMTFLSGAAAILGNQSLKGHQLAAEEINAAGGLLGKRKIETIKADEAAGTDANVKEMRRLKLS